MIERETLREGTPIYSEDGPDATEETQALPVEVMREEVRVAQVEVRPRAAEADELARAFEAAVIRVPVRGEQIVVTKQTVVTGEVVVSRERKVERREITGTVRREHVQVEQVVDGPSLSTVEPVGSRQDAAPPSDETRTFEVAAAPEPTGLAGEPAPLRVEPDLETAQPAEQTAPEPDGGAWDELRAEIRGGLSRARGR